MLRKCYRLVYSSRTSSFDLIDLAGVYGQGSLSRLSCYADLPAFSSEDLAITLATFHTHHPM